MVRPIQPFVLEKFTEPKGKTALDPGSTSGSGLGIAGALAAQGANIVLNGFGDVDGPRAEVVALGVQVGYHGADMSQPARDCGHDDMGRSPHGRPMTTPKSCCRAKKNRQ